MNPSFSQDNVAAMLRIAGEVSELPAAADLHVRRAHILNALLSLVGGCSAVCSEMDPRQVHDGNGWALPDSVTCAGNLSPDQQVTIDRYVTGQLAALDPCVPPLLRQERSAVAVRRCDVVNNYRWHQSAHYNEVRRPLGFGESIYAKLTTPDGRRLKLSFHREMGDRPYTERHAQLLQVFNENLAGLYMCPLAAPAPAAVTGPVQGLDGPMESLPPRLRPVLRRLLAGDAEKQAALRLGLSRHTVHEYIKALYRKFGVNSRGELLAKFVVNA